MTAPFFAVVLSPLWQLAIGPFPFVSSFEKTFVPVGPDELQRLPVLPVLVPILAVQTLERFAAEAVRAVGTGVSRSQPLDAADLHLASGFVDIPFAVLISHPATAAGAVCQRKARSAMSSAAPNLDQGHVSASSGTLCSCRALLVAGDRVAVKADQDGLEGGLSKTL